jgi:hypothetical protein
MGVHDEHFAYQYNNDGWSKKENADDSRDYEIF